MTAHSPILQRGAFFSSPSHSPPLTPLPAGFSTPYYSPAGLTAPASPPQNSSLAGFCSPPSQSHDASFQLSPSSHYAALPMSHSMASSPPPSFPPFTFHSPTDTDMNLDTHSNFASSHSHYQSSELSIDMTRRGSNSSSNSSDHFHPFTPPSDGMPESYFIHGLFPAPSRSSSKRSWDADSELVQPTPKRAYNPAPPTPELTPIITTASAYYPSSTFSPVSRTLSYGGGASGSTSPGAMAPRALSLDGSVEYPFQPSAPYLHPTAQLHPHHQLSPAFSPSAPALRRSDSAPSTRAATYRYPPSPVSPNPSSRFLQPSTPLGLRLELPTSPSMSSHSPYSSSQAALLSATSMNRLLSGSPALPIQRRNTSPSLQYHPQELMHLHHTPASLPQSSYPLSPQSPFRCDRYQLPLQSQREERGHTCLENHCGRVFKRLEHLRRHERTHTSEKPFGCDWDGCGRFFSRSDNLTQHKKTHTKVGGRNGPGGRSTKKGLASGRR